MSFDVAIENLGTLTRPPQGQAKVIMICFEQTGGKNSKKNLGMHYLRVPLTGDNDNATSAYCQLLTLLIFRWPLGGAIDVSILRGFEECLALVSLQSKHIWTCKRREKRWTKK